MLRISLQRSAQNDSNPWFVAAPNALPGIERRYLELVLRVVVVEIRSSPVSFGLPIASTSLPV